MKLSVDGEEIMRNNTPEDFDLENGDQVDVVIR